MRLEMVMWMPYGTGVREVSRRSGGTSNDGISYDGVVPEAEIGRKQLQVAQFGN